MIEAIKNVYAVFDNLQLSITALIVAAVIFSLAFLFAVREAAAWFFKVDDLKRDVRRLREITLQLEGELKLIQNLMLQAREPLEKKASSDKLPPEPTITLASTGTENADKKTTFTISH